MLHSIFIATNSFLDPTALHTHRSPLALTHSHVSAINTPSHTQAGFPASPAISAYARPMSKTNIKTNRLQRKFYFGIGIMIVAHVQLR